MQKEPLSTLLLFADDKTLYAAHRSPSLAAETVTQALKTVPMEVRQNGLSMNVDKTVFMVMRPRHVEAVSVFCDGSPLKEVEQHRCLGVLVDCRLS